MVFSTRYQGESSFTSVLSSLSRTSSCSPLLCEELLFKRFWQPSFCSPAVRRSWHCLESGHRPCCQLLVQVEILGKTADIRVACVNCTRGCKGSCIKLLDLAVLTAL